jgi:hypothetical protein
MRRSCLDRRPKLAAANPRRRQPMQVVKVCCPRREARVSILQSSQAMQPPARGPHGVGTEYGTV